MLLTGNVIAILLAVTSGSVDVAVKRAARSASIEVQIRTPVAFESNSSINQFATADDRATKPFSQKASNHADSISLPAPSLEEAAENGFLFLEGEYIPPHAKLSWNGGRLNIFDPTRNMLASKSGPPGPRPVRFSDGNRRLRQNAKGPSFGISQPELNSISYALVTGGVVHLSKTSRPFVAGYSEGGCEILEAFQVAPGREREQILTTALTRVRSVVTPETRAWLSSFKPDEELADRVDAVVESAKAIETSNRGESGAVRRLNSWNYPLTITAMMIFVIAIGSLLSVRPHELVAVARTEQEYSVDRFLILIVAMSVIDLIWTLLAHQANQIAEVNPVGNVLLGNTMRTIIFKGLATAMAIGIFHRARNNQFARKACWWVCLTLALLMARWVLVSGVST